MKNFLKRAIAFIITISVVTFAAPVTMAATEMVISDVSAGAKTTFTLELQSSDTVSGVVFVATYIKGTDTLKSVQRYDAIPQRDIEVDTPNGESVKVMWWDSVSSLTPFTESGFIPSQSSAFEQTLEEWVESGTGRQSVAISYESLKQVEYDF